RFRSCRTRSSGSWQGSRSAVFWCVWTDPVPPAISPMGKSEYPCGGHWQTLLATESTHRRRFHEKFRRKVQERFYWHEGRQRVCKRRSSQLLDVFLSRTSRRSPSSH